MRQLSRIWEREYSFISAYVMSEWTLVGIDVLPFYYHVNQCRFLYATKTNGCAMNLHNGYMLWGFYLFFFLPQLINYLNGFREGVQ